MYEISSFTKDINKIDQEDICSSWKWIIKQPFKVILVSNIGDMFLVGESREINWLNVGTGVLNKVATEIEEFNHLLEDQENFEKWLMPDLVTQLFQCGKSLQEGEVYSYKTVPSLGGDYSVENFDPTDISVHFAITGQIHEQIKDLPHGTRIDKVQFKKR